MQALLQEIELTRSYLEGEHIDTLYFGGGTPSILEADELKRIVDELSRVYNLNGLIEFTIEANPDDLTTTKVAALSELKRYGLNRFSVGVQSFRAEDLQYMNRVHTADEAISSISRLQEAGFENITIDLIYGTPTMVNEQWLENLDQAFAMQVPHISAYALTVEPRTTLFRKIRKGEYRPVDEQQSAEQFTILTQAMAAHGFQQYEISNFAKPGYHAIHNSNYWLGKKYLGLGPSAHSFNGNSRRWNVSNTLRYAEAISGNHLPYTQEILTPAQRTNEKIMTLLRTHWGLRLADIDPTHAQAIATSLKAVIPAHYRFEDNTIHLSEAGKLFADAIAAQLFVEEA